MYKTIEALCKRDGIKFYNLAQRTGIMPSVFSNLKRRNSKTMKADNLYAIAKYFNVSMEYLMGKEDDGTTDRND